ncbi:response regulator [Xylophilus sp.]|uniref:response regulator n=1 Tax=Xylophilus sp. TaxID=2653893 RepID=UPI0013B5F3A9|nr:response regulator [Xylophilus sp.]KAF1042567.1 MAG: Phyllosphere-induced regulator PhyR [Xylophilus sp.]
MKIMIVEDDALIALELERIVEDAGHELVGTFATSERALAYAMKADAALVDLGLADGQSGAALGRRLIDQNNMKVIYVTGSPAKVGSGIDGAVDVVSKPFSDRRLLDALCKAALPSRREANLAIVR